MVGVFAAIALVICLSFYALAAAKLLQAFSAASGSVGYAVEEAKKAIEAYVLLKQVAVNMTVGNETRPVVKNMSVVVIRNSWPDEVDIDVIVVLDKDWDILRERRFQAGELRLAPGAEYRMNFSEISPDLSAYDEDFWRAKRELGGVLVYPSGGVASYAGWGTLDPVDVSKCSYVNGTVNGEPVLWLVCT